ncbi:MAG: hypothetical protein LUM44_19290 [Pyrinomonadaceae bacterium]|nr:hypothetical protein [Pyrinomonadaceae bacterium]
MKTFTVLLFVLMFSLSVFAQDWKKMANADLQKSVPEKAPVIKEDIETELRTASGISDGKNQIFGVVIITAGYEADGKYTHFLRTSSTLNVGELTLKPGDYIFGYQRIDDETLRVMFYYAKDGELIGATKAKTESKKGPIYSFLIEPPIDKKGKIYIGRFNFEYSLD